MNKKVLAPVIIFSAAMSLPSSARAEDVNVILKRMNEYIAQENFPKALEELSWAEKEVQKMNMTKLGKVLPADVQGFTGQPVSTQSAMGFSTIEREYKKGTQQITLSIAGAAGAGSPAGGLAGLARMGMLMGAEQGSETFRLDGKTATLKTDEGSPEITVALDSGSILSLKAGSGVDQTVLKSFAEAIKVSEIDNYLRGSK